MTWGSDDDLPLPLRPLGNQAVCDATHEQREVQATNRAERDLVALSPPTDADPSTRRRGNITLPRRRVCTAVLVRPLTRPGGEWLKPWDPGLALKVGR